MEQHINTEERQQARHTPGPWTATQAARGIVVIERTYLARIPSGAVVEVNCFDYNINIAAGTLDKYIQLEDGAWIQVKALTLLTPTEQQAAIAKSKE